jgi:hypothetical protein
VKHTLKLTALDGDRATFTKWHSESPTGTPGVALTRTVFVEDWRDKGRPVDLEVEL